MEVRYDIKIRTMKEFEYFIKFCEEVNLKWESRDLPRFSEFKTFKDRLTIFYCVDDKYVGLFTSLDTTYNRPDAHYISMDFNQFKRCTERKVFINSFKR